MKSNCLICGLRDRRSIAYSIGEELYNNNWRVAFTAQSKNIQKKRKLAEKIDTSVFEMNVVQDESIQSAKNKLGRELGWDSLEGLVHSIAYADTNCFNSNPFQASEEDLIMATRISALSLPKIMKGFSPLLKNKGGAGVVALTFSTQKINPEYGYMNPIKKFLNSLVKYLANGLGEYDIRVNAIASGAIRTLSAKAIPKGKNLFERQNPPLEWNPKQDAKDVAQATRHLLEQKKTTGAILPVDSGAHLN